MRKRTAQRRLSLQTIFATRSVGITQKDRARKLWMDTANVGYLAKLQNPEIYPGEMPKVLSRNFRRFLQKWFDRRTKLEVSLHKESKKIARARRITENQAYWTLLKSREKEVEKLFSEKAALEQIAWVLKHQKMLKTGGKRIDPLEAGAKVRELAQELNRAGDKAGAFVRLAKLVSEIEFIVTNETIAQAYYGLPTAEETLVLNGILVAGRPLWGCGMLCDVMNAVLTQARWKNYQVRTVDVSGQPHSVVLAELPTSKKLLLADPYGSGEAFLTGVENFRGSSVVSQVGQYLGEEIKRLRARGKWRKGHCQRDLVRNFKEFAGGR